MAARKELREGFQRYFYLPRTKLDYMTGRKLRSLKASTVGDAGWDQYFKYLTRGVQLSPTIHERIQEGSMENLLKMWMSNFSENIPYIRDGDNILYGVPEGSKPHTLYDLLEKEPMVEGEPEFNMVEGPIEEYDGLKVRNPSKGSAVVVGRGPSLFKNKHCEMLADAINSGAYKGMVVASDGGLIPLLEAGVVPNVVISVDGAPVIKKWFDHPLVTKYGPQLKWIVTVTVNHEVYKLARKAGVQTYWFNPMFDDWRQNESWTKLQRLLTKTDKLPKSVPAINSGGNAGACSWIMAMEVFFRSPIAFIGIDFGYPEETKLEDTHYFSSAMRIAKNDVKLIREAYKEFYHPIFKTKAYVDMVFYHYRQAMIEMQLDTKAWYRLYGGTINCTEGGTLFGYGIKCMKFKEFLEKWQK